MPTERPVRTPADRSGWRIDPEVAGSLAGALGWSPDDDVAALAQRMPERLPVGSTAKLAAIVAGVVPPGADPDDLARRMVAHLAGAPSPSWSCWVMATVMAALVETVGGRPATVVGLRRIDDRSPIVDFHSAVAVEEGARTWICDPYFGSVVAVAADGRSADDGSATYRSVELWPASAAVTLEPGGRWTHVVRLHPWTEGLGYRVIAPDLDRGDVAALCAVSVQHSGVPFRPYARLHAGPGIVSVHEAEDGSASCSTWARPTAEVDAVGPAEPTIAAFPTWSAAVEHVTEHIGVTIT